MACDARCERIARPVDLIDEVGIGGCEKFCERCDDRDREKYECANERELVLAESFPDAAAFENEIVVGIRYGDGAGNQRNSDDLLLVVFHARVEVCVRDVGEQIEEHDEERYDHEVAHEQRKIELSERAKE